MRVRVYPYMKSVVSAEYPKIFFDIISSNAMEITVKSPAQSRVVFGRDRVIIEHGDIHIIYPTSSTTGTRGGV